MARPWNAIGKQLTSIAKEQAPKLVRSQAPKLVERLQKSGVLPNVANGAPARSRTAIDVRPVASNAVPTSERARRIVYAPRLDGRADPGEVVWTWVTYEEDPHNGKDRPVLVVGRDRDTLLGLMLSSNASHAADRNWISIGKGGWDHEGRPSWVRLDRVLDVPEQGIRREGAILERKVFDEVAARLCHEYSWH
ncbi:type II toxin-antitoxin system PemK/MazF family toxin [Antrihabitans sp. YC3-6]|uniref:Type II toxin-antitoxin system PemK/MazF family toxin n=1 Tax=Antrihabitans stalagmiti TaxID=2799499 RepID=A0A934NVF7_9NOCA|nr:type II toxin-antitoxin system PemK/MazF family toxin [Antrihabitans stalagmiti]MBJ8342313.1 type II toxin-antitoxin system PemK/MazF family toxin [Antrihabitans stalagmiti]